MNLILLTIILFFSTSVYSRNSINIAVASNFILPIKKIAQKFEKETGNKVLLSFGATRSIYTKIKHGAPYDIFLAADEETPKILENEDYAIKGSRFTYAIGTLVIYAPNEKFKDILTADKIAIANPRFAPYGIAAIDSLKSLDLYHNIKHKIIQGSNVSQAFQFAYTGNAQVAIVSLSQVINRKDISKDTYWKISHKNYKPIKQQAALLSKAKNNPSAVSFLNFLRTKESQSIIRSYGYNINEEL